MNSIEAPLRTMRMQVQFEIAQIAAVVARTTAISASAEHEVRVLTQRCRSVERELRTAMNQLQINPALLAALHRLNATEHRGLQEAHARLKVAREREDKARQILAEMRNQERSLERALRTDGRRKELERAAIEFIRADEMWLQHDRHVSS